MKATIRQESLKKRKLLSKEGREKKDSLIKNNLVSLKEFKEAKTIMFYVSFSSEVNTHEIIKELLKDKSKKIIVPYLEEENKIQISEINSFDDLKPGRKGILEPDRIIPAGKEDIDLVIVPGAAFDKEGNRIGFGYGYYDIFLKTVNAVKIGLAYDFQVTEKIPSEEHDVLMDIIITESKVIKANKK